MDNNEAEFKEQLQAELPVPDEKPCNTSLDFANDYTGTTIGKICSKSSKNFLLLITIITIIMIYYFYLHWNIVFILAKSNTGLNHRFWDHKNLSDKVYLKGLIYFTAFHVFFLFFLIAFYKAVFTTPGYFSKEYVNTFSLKKKLNGEEEEQAKVLTDDSMFEADFDISDVEKMFESDVDNSEDLSESKIVLNYKRGLIEKDYLG